MDEQDNVPVSQEGSPSNIAIELQVATANAALPQTVGPRNGESLMK